jgi:hypothetical protein
MPNNKLQVKKTRAKKTKAASVHKGKIPPRSSEKIDEARLNQIIRIVRGASEEAKTEDLTLELSKAEREYMVDGLTKAKRYRRLHEEHKKLKQKHDLFDEVAEYYLNIIVRARMVVSKKGGVRGNSKEVLKILNASLPKPGKRATSHNEDFKLEVLKYHEGKIEKFKKEEGTNKITPQQKAQAVLAVRDEYFPHVHPDSVRRKYLSKWEAEELPGGSAFDEQGNIIVGTKPRQV